MLRARPGQAAACTYGRPVATAAHTLGNKTINATKPSCFAHTNAPFRPVYRSQHHRRTRFQPTRLRAVPVAQVAQIGEQAAELLAIVGIAVGGVFVALWNVEKQSKQSLEQEVTSLKEQLAAAQQQTTQLQQQLEDEHKAREEAESWRPRLDDAQKELFKLERALEMKDAQLATFMTTAHRQIRSLEDNVKELQKM